GIRPGLGRCGRELVGSMSRARRRDQRPIGSSPEATRGYQKLTGSLLGACRRRSGACQDDDKEFIGRRPSDPSEDRQR
ncbi:hypothetical protein BHE74_00058910, partial [Ensete ventricosum]